jgi:hypothetical protein
MLLAQRTNNNKLTGGQQAYRSTNSCALLRGCGRHIYIEVSAATSWLEDHVSPKREWCGQCPSPYKMLGLLFHCTTLNRQDRLSN